MMRKIGVATLFCFSLGLPPSLLAQNRAMVVHLPEAPLESMGKLGEGVTQLASYVAANVPNLPLEVKAFRKSADASQFIAASGGNVALVACDAAFVLDLPPGYDVVHRFVRGGRETRRKLIIVKRDSGLGSLADLRGRTLTVPMPEGPRTARYLSDVVFGRELDVSWFGGVAYETDDFTATASVLYGRTDAALVSEDNPLVASHLNDDLVEVYASDPVSMSVIAVNGALVGPAERASLERLLDDFATAPDTASIRAALLFDGFRRVDGARLLADLRGSASTGRELEVAMPALGPLPMEALPSLGAYEIPFVVGIELMEVEIPATLVDSVLKEKAQ